MLTFHSFSQKNI